MLAVPHSVAKLSWPLEAVPRSPPLGSDAIDCLLSVKRYLLAQNYDTTFKVRTTQPLT